jgi:hypothetical protein
MPHAVAEIDGSPYHLVAAFRFPGAGYTVMSETPCWVNLETGEIRDYDDVGTLMPEKVAPELLGILRNGGAQCGDLFFILIDMRNYQRLLGMVAALKEGLASEGDGPVVVVSHPDSNLTVRHADSEEMGGWQEIAEPA